jgi:zinc/manganese transport system substrate-binding protein
MPAFFVALLAVAVSLPGGPLPPRPLPTTGPVKVVTTLTTYAAIAREIVGDRGTVLSIAQGDEDPHFVQPRPSFLPALRDADLFVTTGMDLEAWVPALLDRANNGNVREGGRGYVAAFQGVRLMDVPTSTSRAQGDIHVDGNPHLQGDPINAIIIARNILAGLTRVSPDNAASFTGREQDFEQRILRALFGDDLVRILTPATIFELARTDRVMDFLRTTPYQGQPLLTRLGGWMRQAQAFSGREMVCYHMEYSYFSRRFGIACAGYVEPKPGIPPTPRHVEEIIDLMRTRHIPVILAANYYDRHEVLTVAERTGATALIEPDHTEGAPGVTTYFDLMNRWVTDLAHAFTAAGAR